MINMYIVWYERRRDFTADYDREHHGTITGRTPGECMRIFHEIARNHDLARYTRLEISYIY